MPESPPSSWKRLAVEAPVIVISILLAFAIDAWWEARSDRNAEIALLERLRADFVDIGSALSVVEDEHREARDACLYFMKQAFDSALPATPEVDRRVAIVFLASRTFNPGSGAIASFHSGDGTRLIRNPVLADKLMAWSSVVDELQEEEDNLQKGVAERWTPFIASRVSIGPYVATADDLAEGMPPDISAPTDREPLVVDRDFTNHVLDRFKWQQLALRDIRPVRRAIGDILSLIGEELGE